MDSSYEAALLGAATGTLGLLGRRWPLVSWVALAPLLSAVERLPITWAASAAGLAGVLIAAGPVWGRFPIGMIAFVCSASAGVWAGAAALSVALMPRDLPVLGVLLLAISLAITTLPLRVLGAPRWIYNPLAITQEPLRTVIHAARIGGDGWVVFALALSGGSLGLWLAVPMLSVRDVAGVCVSLSWVAGWLAAGHARRRATERRLPESSHIRVAAVAADARGLADEAELSRNVDAAIRRYEVQVRIASRAGARVVVLPEVAVTIGPSTRDAWFAALRRWAADAQAVLVAGHYDELSRQNQLVVVDRAGQIRAEYEKQHPGPHEPKRHERTPPLCCADLEPELPPLSAVICADLDYADLVGPVRAARGLLVVPSNDWPGLEELHHRTAIWAAVATGVPVVRATGHGVSAVYDASGRVLARDSSLAGPVALVVDVPVDR